jgi:hypothetical protein
VASQIGVRRSAHLLEPGRILIGLAGLPPGWTMLDQRRWRTGQRSDQPWAARARALGSVTAWRSFAHEGRNRWLWAQATPLAGSSQGTPWSWEDLAALATLQSGRIDARTADAS